jgi:hypothetical protein
MVKRWSVVCAVVLAPLTQSPVRSAQQVHAGADAISLRTSAVDGLNLQYLIAGHGPTIVLLHGYLNYHTPRDLPWQVSLTGF